MPTLSMFYGILVSMYLMDTQEHRSPHIYVRFGEFRAVFGIPDGNLLAGELPGKKQKLVEAWVAIHADELMANWSLAIAGQELFKINPFALRRSPMSKPMNPEVIAVNARADFCLHVTFENGENKLFDVNPYLQLPVFQRLKTANYFQRAHVENGTVAWDDQLDLSPDTLYLQGTPVGLASFLN